MHLNLHLISNYSSSLLPINYQYPLSAVIYKILARADSEYATFLHEKGYRHEGSLKSFKLFSFSDLKTPFKIKGDRLQLLTREAKLQVSFHLPMAAENFIKGLFMNQQLEIADKRSKAVFTVAQVEALPVPLKQEEIQELVLQPLSPIVCGIIEKDRKHYTFLSPEDADFISQLMNNWKEKYKVVYGAVAGETDFKDADMKVLFYKNPPRSRLLTIKAGTDAETKIRGFVNFRLKVRGKREALELLLNSGVGIYNAQGMGCVGASEIIS